MQASTWTLLVVLTGCGASVAEHEDFRVIQRAEAQVHGGLERATDPDRECAARCDGMDQTCNGADDICEVADDTDDKDAQARCELAGRQCDAAKLRVSTPCGCN